MNDYEMDQLKDNIVNVIREKIERRWRKCNHGTDALKRLEEIKKKFKGSNKYKLTLEIEDIKDLIQMVDLLIKRNSIEKGNLKELRIFFKDERILIIKTNRIFVGKETLECFDNERNLWFTFNLNEIIYYTLEKVGEENVWSNIFNGRNHS